MRCHSVYVLRITAGSPRRKRKLQLVIITCSHSRYFIDLNTFNLHVLSRYYNSTHFPNQEILAKNVQVTCLMSKERRFGRTWLTQLRERKSVRKQG